MLLGAGTHKGGAGAGSSSLFLSPYGLCFCPYFCSLFLCLGHIPLLIHLARGSCGFPATIDCNRLMCFHTPRERGIGLAPFICLSRPHESQASVQPIGWLLLGSAVNLRSNQSWPVQLSSHGRLELPLSGSERNRLSRKKQEYLAQAA